MTVVESAKTVWWAGMQKECPACGCKVQLDAADVHESPHFRRIKHDGIPTFEFNCPICTYALLVERTMPAEPPVPVLNWAEALAHLSDVVGQYLEASKLPGVNTSFALNYVLRPLKARYAGGERTPELYKEMLEVK